MDRLRRDPRVTDAAFTSELPLTAGGSTAAFTLRAPNGPMSVQASPRVVSAESFSALGMRIVAGRGFSAQDNDATAPVAVVNRAFATRYLNGAALGIKVPMGLGYQDADSDAEIVGVVDDVRYVASNDATQPEIYYSYRQLRGRLPVPVVTLLVRAQGDPNALAGALRAAVHDADGTLVAEAVSTLEDRVLVGLARPRLYLALFGGFAAFAIVIAGVGLFAVVSYSVAQRSREIAVRSALGARPSQIVALVMRQTVTIAIGGIAIGLSGAVVLSRSMATFLYGVTPHDAVTFVSVPMLLLAVTAIACFVPARRAALRRTGFYEVLQGSTRFD
jgi:putative ABC transport system permease protein